MADFNSDLNNLFKNYQQQQQYNKKAFDVNGDGKVNSKDKSQLTTNKNNLLKKTELFDFNNDGKLDQKDVDLFLKGDINQDGKVSQDELNFVSAYKKELTTAFTKQKADFTIDGKRYVKGKLESEVYNDGNTKKTIKYNDDGTITQTEQVIGSNEKNIYTFDSNWKKLKTTTVKYNDDGTITQTEQNASINDKVIYTFDSNWKKLKTISVKYNDDGTITQTEQNGYISDKVIYTFDSNGKKLKTTTVKYNENGTITQTEQAIGSNEKNIYTFDSNWKKLKTISVKYNDDGTITQTEQNGYIRDKVIYTFDSNWKKLKTTTVKYNKDGTITQTEQVMGSNKKNIYTFDAERTNHKTEYTNIAYTIKSLLGIILPDEFISSEITDVKYNQNTGNISSFKYKGDTYIVKESLNDMSQWERNHFHSNADSGWLVEVKSPNGAMQFALTETIKGKEQSRFMKYSEVKIVGEYSYRNNTFSCMGENKVYTAYNIYFNQNGNPDDSAWLLTTEIKLADILDVSKIERSDTENKSVTIIINGRKYLFEKYGNEPHDYKLIEEY